MSRSSEPDPRPAAKRAVALQYGVMDQAPVVVAAGMGYLAERIVDVAGESGVPVYEDNSLATILSQLNVGQEIPEELYRAVVEIYVYFLNFDFDRQAQGQGRRRGREARPSPQEGARQDQENQEG